MPKIKVNGRINKVNGNYDARLRAVYKEEHRAKGVTPPQYHLKVWLPRLNSNRQDNASAASMHQKCAK